MSGTAVISTRGDPSWADVIAFQIAQGIDETTALGFESLFGLKDGILQKYLNGYKKQDATWVFMFLGLPKSVGSVKLASSNPMDSPIIDPNFYSDPKGEDVKAMVKGYKFMIDLYEKSQAFRKYNSSFISNLFPGCESHVGDRDKDLECRIKMLTSTTYHPTSTCRMGKPDDPNAVVDSNLRVRGVKGLRIADGSVMPMITNANTNAPIMMIGEKAADLILKDWCVPERQRRGKTSRVLENFLPFRAFAQTRRADAGSGLACQVQPS
jgi:choline dehydrogenase